MLSSDKAALIHSAFFTLGSVCLGLVQGIVGPTLLDLAEIYRVDTNEVSQVYTSRSIGMLIGSAIACFGVKKRNSELVLTVTLLVQGLFIAVVPVLGNLLFAHGAFILVGVVIVIYETCSMVVLANLWTNPTLQFQLYELAFAFGTFVIPFIAAPFLSQDDPIGLGKLQHASASRIYLPYAGVGVSCVILGISMITFSYFVALPLQAKTKDNTSEETGANATDACKIRFDAVEIVLVLLLSAFIFFDVCVENCYTGMIAPFVVQSNLHMDKADGAFMGGVFRSTFFAGRILTVIGYKLSLRMVILSSLSFLLLSSIVLSLFAMMAPLFVWLASVGLGLGLSTLYGTSVSWTCQYVTLKHWHMGLLMVASCMGSTSPAFLVAPWIDYDQMLLMYVMVSLSLLIWTTFGLMMLLVKGRTKGSSKE